MNPALAVFTAIFMAIFMVAGMAVAAATYALGIVFNIIKAPIVSLHAIVNHEGKETKSPAQLIIYLLFAYLMFC